MGLFAGFYDNLTSLMILSDASDLKFFQLVYQLIYIMFSLK